MIELTQPKFLDSYGMIDVPPSDKRKAGYCYETFFPSLYFQIIIHFRTTMLSKNVNIHIGTIIGIHTQVIGTPVPSAWIVLYIFKVPNSFPIKNAGTIEIANMNNKDILHRACKK